MLAAVASYRFALCDVFTRQPLRGNALAVFTDARGLDGETMQAIARETNLSETTFVLPAEGDGDVRVRIFTPGRELPFAGHPLLGTAAVLGRGLPLERLRLETGIGAITVALEREGGEVAGAVMEQREPAFSDLPEAEAAAVAEALGVDPRPVTVGDNGIRVGLLQLGSEEELAALAPDPARLRSAASQIETLSAFALRDGADEVRVRVFAPWAGVAEDPGTGSAAGPLAVHLVRSGLRPAGLLTLLQGVEMGRPSVIDVVIGDGPPRVGGAVAVFARGAYELSR
jgi:trans-2,3-dihydro-3-hydroxyanthranilate isomerase